MRFLSTSLLALAVSATSSVRANTLHQYKQRSAVDVCANVNADLKINGIDFGHLSLCLCVSGIASLVASIENSVVFGAVLINGKASVTAALTSLINSAADHASCNYPDNCTPECGSGNPCGFTCKNGYTPYPASHPTECVCEYPNTVCNGQCGNFPHCSSQYPKRDAAWRDATCPHGWSACGVWGGSRLDYECVDVTKDLWSCGGCGVPLLPGDPSGVDCTAIAGVHDVGCHAGRCVVERCKEGFNVSSDRSTCVPTTRMSPVSPPFVYNNPYNKPREAEA